MNFNQMIPLLRLKILFLLIFLKFTFLYKNYAWALEGMDSGGGKSVICFDNEKTHSLVVKRKGLITQKELAQIRSIETLDYYYAKRKIGLEPRRPRLISYEQYNHFMDLYFDILERLKSEVPALAKAIEDAKETFEESEIIWEEQPLGPIFDEQIPSIILRKWCTLTTVAIQYKEGNIHYLHIDEQLFNHSRHNLLSQVSLLLHEFLYLVGRKRGHSSSLFVRKLMRLLLRHPDVIDYPKIKAYAEKFKFIHST